MKKKIILKKPLLKKPTHNEKRRAKYQSDEKYREAVKANARQKYRKEAGKEISSCLRSLDFYTTLAKSERVALTNGTVRTLPVMNLPTTALLLEKRYQTVWRWVKKEMIPEPVLKLANKDESVYHSDEVRVIIEEVGELEKRFAYYCKNHIQTKNRIFALIKAVRKQHQLGE